MRSLDLNMNGAGIVVVFGGALAWQLSIRRVNHLLSWLNSLRLSPTRIDIRTLHVDFSNGIVLCKLMQHLVPGVEYPGLNPRPLAKRAAIENIERALSVIWRSKTINTTRIPKAADIFTVRVQLTLLFGFGAVL